MKIVFISVTLREINLNLIYENNLLKGLDSLSKLSAFVLNGDSICGLLFVFSNTQPLLKNV